MSEKSMSIIVIMNEDSDDVFTVTVDDGEGNMWDVTASYELQSAELPDGRQGIVVVVREEEQADVSINPFDMPGEEDA